MVSTDEQGGTYDGGFQYSLCRVVLMVESMLRATAGYSNFQYSLCRVVLMVVVQEEDGRTIFFFQYSLCRVVLMVEEVADILRQAVSLSVLALSSRFDGHGCRCGRRLVQKSFSTRSVESF